MPNRTPEDERYQAETEQIAANTELTKAHIRLMNAQAVEVEQKNNGKR